MPHRLSLRQLWLPMVLVLYGLFALSTVFGDRGLLHLWRLDREQQALETNVFILLRENEALRNRIARLQTDDEFFEKVVREELGFVRPGELVYHFQDTTAAPVP